MFSAHIKSAVMLFSFLLLSIAGFAQSSDAKAQPVKKTNAAPVTNTNTIKAAPWEKQPIQPGKSKAAATNSKPGAKPEEPQPIQRK